METTSVWSSSLLPEPVVPPTSACDPSGPRSSSTGPSADRPRRAVRWVRGAASQRRRTATGDVTSGSRSSRLTRSGTDRARCASAASRSGARQPTRSIMSAPAIESGDTSSRVPSRWPTSTARRPATVCRNGAAVGTDRASRPEPHGGDADVPRIDDGRQQCRVGPQPVVDQHHQGRRPVAAVASLPLGTPPARQVDDGREQGVGGPAVRGQGRAREPAVGQVGEPPAPLGRLRPASAATRSTSAGLCRAATWAPSHARVRSRSRPSPSDRRDAVADEVDDDRHVGDPDRARVVRSALGVGDDRLGRLPELDGGVARRRAEAQVQEVGVPGLALPQARGQASADLQDLVGAGVRRAQPPLPVGARASDAVQGGGALLLVGAAVLAQLVLARAALLEVVPGDHDRGEQGEQGDLPATGDDHEQHADDQGEQHRPPGEPPRRPHAPTGRDRHHVRRLRAHGPRRPVDGDPALVVPGVALGPAVQGTRGGAGRQADGEREPLAAQQPGVAEADRAVQPRVAHQRAGLHGARGALQAEVRAQDVQGGARRHVVRRDQGDRPGGRVGPGHLEVDAHPLRHGRLTRPAARRRRVAGRPGVWGRTGPRPCRPATRRAARRPWRRSAPGRPAARGRAPRTAGSRGRR